MDIKKEGFILTSSPHFHSKMSTKKIMYIVIITLIPAIIMSILFFGIKVIPLYFTGVFFAMASEVVVKLIRKKSIYSFLDGSAAITGILLVMTLPPDIGWQKTALGAVIAIVIAKELFGGLGSNIFNPALVGRAFLAAAYPVSMTTFSAANNVFSLGSVASQVTDAVSSATPLAAAKFDRIWEPLQTLLIGQRSGCIGETSSIALIIGGLVLIALKLINFRLVFSYIGTVFMFGLIIFFTKPEMNQSPLFHVFSGGLILGAFYMATDMVTTPYTNAGAVIFGIGAGLLVSVIRFFGGYPEGVMYSILIMNSFTPLINRFVNNKVFGSLQTKSQ